MIIYFQNTRLNQGQITKILSGICSPENNLTSINMSYNSLALVTPDLPAKAALKVSSKTRNEVKVNFDISVENIEAKLV